MSLATFKKLLTLFDDGNAEYHVMEHAPARTSEEAAQIRGSTPGQGAKAMIVRVKHSSNKHTYVHVVLPGDQRVSFDKVAQAAKGKKASLATAEEAQQITDCMMGAVPPVSFDPDVPLIVDPYLLEHNEKLFFNAGLRERSISICTQDYIRIVQPIQTSIVETS